MVDSNPPSPVSGSKRSDVSRTNSTASDLDMETTKSVIPRGRLRGRKVSVAPDNLPPIIQSQRRHSLPSQQQLDSMRASTNSERLQRKGQDTDQQLKSPELFKTGGVRVDPRLLPKDENEQDTPIEVDNDLGSEDLNTDNIDDMNMEVTTTGPSSVEEGKKSFFKGKIKLIVGLIATLAVVGAGIAIICLGGGPVLIAVGITMVTVGLLIMGISIATQFFSRETKSEKLAEGNQDHAILDSAKTLEKAKISYEESQKEFQEINDILDRIDKAEAEEAVQESDQKDKSEEAGAEEISQGGIQNDDNSTGLEDSNA